MTAQTSYTDTTEYVEKDGKRLRRGFTTGSCAAAAATAAAQMLMTGEVVDAVQIKTPGGPAFHATILDVQMQHAPALETQETQSTQCESESARCSCRCAVRKDGGDDPDITTGTKIVAEVFLSDEPGITIDGGIGVGRVTKPGLDQPVGQAAINRVPRKMITENVAKILRKWQEGHNEKGQQDAPKGLHVIISAPDGEALAEKTFNPKLGIVGGISILGTTGIVEPMSDRAIVETIRTQMRVLKAQGQQYVIAAPGNYGLAFLKERYGGKQNEIADNHDAAETATGQTADCTASAVEIDVVQISNFVGEAVEMAADMGFEGFLLVGHIGKLVKVAGGARNTHSKYGDHRMETLWDMAEMFCPEEEKKELKKELMECVMTDAALEVLDRFGRGEQSIASRTASASTAQSNGLLEQTAQEMARRICANLAQWSGGRMQTETIVFSHQDRELVRSQGAEEMIQACHGSR